jgi:hypothetical protein
MNAKVVTVVCLAWLAVGVVAGSLGQIAISGPRTTTTTTTTLTTEYSLTITRDAIKTPCPCDLNVRVSAYYPQNASKVYLYNAADVLIAGAITTKGYVQFTNLVLGYYSVTEVGSPSDLNQTEGLVVPNSNADWGNQALVDFP